MPSKAKISFSLLFFIPLIGIILCLLSSLTIALPPPPPAAPSLPGFTYNDTNSTPVSNVTVNTTVTNTTNTTTNTTSDVTVTGADDADDSEPEVIDETFDDGDTSDSFIGKDSDTGYPIITTDTNGISDESGYNPSTLGQSDNISPTGVSDTNILDKELLLKATSDTDNDGEIDLDDSANADPLLDSPSGFGSGSGIKTMILSTVKSTLGKISAVVLLVLMLLFVVLNRDSKSRNVKEKIVIHPHLSLPQQIQQMPLQQMPPRVGPTGPQSQRLQLKYQQMLLQRKKFVHYQRYLHKFQRERLLNSQNQEQSILNLGQQGSGLQQYQQSSQQSPQNPPLRPKI